MYHMNKIILLIVATVLLTGCAVGERKIKIFSIEEPRQNLNHPMPTPLEMEEIRWIIINSENARCNSFN